MIPSFFLSLREGVEAALIIGIALAALVKMNRKELSSSVWQGTIAAVVLSILAGLGFNWLGAEFEGRGEQIFEGTAMMIAAVFLSWMIIWLQRQAGSTKDKLEAEVQEASQLGKSRAALFALAFLSVGREGFELALFLTAIQMTSTGIQTLTGAILGLIVAVVFGWVTFRSSKRLSLRIFFSVTNILLILFAAGLLSHGVHEFNEAGIIPSLINQVWNINPILDENSTLGQFLVALFGYNGNPSLTEVLAYGLYLVSAIIFWKKNSKSG